MMVRALELEGFRNYRSFSASFAPGVNVIYGENAQGKTNLLEAVRYLSGTPSHRARSEGELIGFDASSARICAQLESRGRLPGGGAADPGPPPPDDLQRRAPKTTGELSERLHTVLFCPRT